MNLKRGGGTVDTVLLIAIYVLAVLFTYLYFKRENNDTVTAKNGVESLGSRVASLEQSRVDMQGSVDASVKGQLDFASSTVSQLAQLNERMKHLDNERPIRVVMPKSIEVSIVRMPESSPKSSTVGKSLTGPLPGSTKTPLLNRAGITKQKTRNQ